MRIVAISEFCLMLCDPRAESLIENFINVVPPIQQVRTQLNSVAAFARPDGPDGTRGLLAAHPPLIVNFHKGWILTDARLGRLFGRGSKTTCGKCCGGARRPVRPNTHAMNKLLTLAACTLGPVNIRTKLETRAVNPKTFWRHPSLHPHITYGDRFRASVR